jgi:hypothetical protein
MLYNVNDTRDYEWASDGEDSKMSGREINPNLIAKYKPHED